MQGYHIPAPRPHTQPRNGAVVAMIIWQLDLQLAMQSVHITTDVVGSTPAQGEVYNIMC